MPLSDLETSLGLRVPAGALRWWASRASGPGGQKVNKTASKVELRIQVAAIDGLAPDARRRLRSLAGHRWLEGGELRFVSESARSQADNLRECLAQAQQLLDAAAIRPKRRRATKPTRASKRRRLDAKRKRKETKRLRGSVGRES